METILRKKVVVADDDEDDRMLLGSVFRENRADVNLDFVADGSELMKVLADPNTANEISFILLDLNMPRKDGREALKEIKENETLKKIPVIIFTTAKNQSEIRQCYELGANTYIVKPDGIAALRKVVANLSTYWLDTAAVPQGNAKSG